MATYKKPLKSCEGCSYISFVIDEGKKKEFCTIFGDKFDNKCKNKRETVRKENANNSNLRQDSKK